MHNNIIFAIDASADDQISALFEAGFKSDSKRTGSLVPCHGYWEGISERSYICNRQDFEAIVKAGGWVDGQECVLAVTSCNKMYAQLEYPDGSTVSLGSMHQVHEVEAHASAGYTYRPDINAYWVAKQGNPDNAYRESAARVADGFYDAPAVAAE